MGNLRITLFALLLVIWPTNTNHPQTRFKDSDSEVMVVSRKVNGQVVRRVNSGQPGDERYELKKLSDLCREPGRNHNVISWVDDSNNVAELFDALKWIEQAKCDGTIGTVVWHKGKAYGVNLREVRFDGIE